MQRFFCNQVAVSLEDNERLMRQIRECHSDAPALQALQSLLLASAFSSFFAILAAALRVSALTMAVKMLRGREYSGLHGTQIIRLN
jgi:hypothetical protein